MDAKTFCSNAGYPGDLMSSEEAGEIGELESSRFNNSNKSSKVSKVQGNIETFSNQVADSNLHNADHNFNFHDLRPPLLEDYDQRQDMDFCNPTNVLSSRVSNYNQVVKPLQKIHSSYLKQKRNYPGLRDFPIKKRCLQIKFIDKVPYKKHGFPLFDRDFRTFTPPKTTHKTFDGYFICSTALKMQTFALVFV